MEQNEATKLIMLGFLFKRKADGNTEEVDHRQFVIEKYDMKLSVKLSEHAVVPTRAHATDAGMDLYSKKGYSSVLAGQARGLVETGVQVAIPEGYVGLILDKSGLALNQGLTVLGGVIDSGYRGEICVILQNTSKDTITIASGQKVAQMVIMPIETPEIEVVDELPEAGDERGKDGFGSTGV